MVEQFFQLRDRRQLLLLLLGAMKYAWRTCSQRHADIDVFGFMSQKVVSRRKASRRAKNCFDEGWNHQSAEHVRQDRERRENAFRPVMMTMKMKKQWSACGLVGQPYGKVKKAIQKIIRLQVVRPVPPHDVGRHELYPVKDRRSSRVPVIVI